MAQCTAPIRGHRTAAAAAACPVCGGRRSYYQFGYNTYPSFSAGYSRVSSSSHSSGTSNGGMKRKAKWSPAGSTVMYTQAQITTLTPVRENITAGFNAIAKNGGNKLFMGRIVSDLHPVYTF